MAELPMAGSSMVESQQTGTSKKREAEPTKPPTKTLGKTSLKQKGKDVRPTTRKTIKGPGLIGLRTAQACDRCRAKKSRCDGKQPACSLCAAAGLECVVSDRLTRKSYPKGYTELLEEQARQLIAENARLKGALDLRDEQLALMSAQIKEGGATDRPNIELYANPDQAPPDAAKITNLSEFLNPHLALHIHNPGEGCVSCGESLIVHERPVSVAGSVYSDFDDEFGVECDYDHDVLSELSDESFLLRGPGSRYQDTQSLRRGYTDFYNRQIKPAPGAFAAATAIEQMQKKRADGTKQMKDTSKEQMLTNLVAASVPRSTEETLLIPTLLARVCEAYGYSSTPAKLTASAIAALKDTLSSPLKFAGKLMSHENILPLIFNTDLQQLNALEATTFLRLIDLPGRNDLEHLISLYFEEWGNVMPIINQKAFLKNYPRFSEIHELGFTNLPPQYFYELTEKLGAILVLVVSLALLLKKFTMISSSDANVVAEYKAKLARFDFLIHEFVKPNCILTKACSLQSLQILALALQYCLATGDYMACYELRGRVITMAQQLRLHRCPAAVLGLSREMNDRDLKAFMQAERRIVFWCVYVLDVYSSRSLGIPRLLKDYEIECATPFSGKTDEEAEDKNDENILIVNNTKLTIFGKVPRISLCLMQFSKVLGSIMDMIFSRSGNYDVHEKAIEKDQMLDCWRRDLPQDFKFDIETGINGLLLDDSSASDETKWKKSTKYNKHQSLLIFLYYHAKLLIYLPIISKYGYHHNVGLSMKEKLSLGQHDVSTNISSMTLIQQSAIQILHLLKSLAIKTFHLLPVPLNVPREQARLAILVAKGSLDYIKGGPLHQQLKQLLLETLPIFKQETGLELPNSMTKRGASLLEYAVLSILGLNLARNSTSGSLRKRIISNESMSRVGSSKGSHISGSEMYPEAYTNAEAFTHSESFDVPMIGPLNLPKDFVNAEFDQDNSSHSASHTTPQMLDQASSTQPDRRSNGSLKDILRLHTPSPGPFEQSNPVVFEDPTNVEAQNEETAEYFKFDELFKSFGSDVMNSQFVTDGSLGLVPFLNEPHELVFSPKPVNYFSEDHKMHE